MTTPNLSTTDLRTSEEARDLQTLLSSTCIPLWALSPRVFLRRSVSTNLTTTRFILICTRKMLSLLPLTVSVSL